MSVRVQRLSNAHEHALEELLDEDRLVNLFLLGSLSGRRVRDALWVGAVEGDLLLGVVLLVGDRVAVPYSPNEEVSRAIGAHLRRRHRVSRLLVGPREAVDALFGAWSPRARGHIAHDQRLYVADAAPEPPPEVVLRRATYDEWPTIADNAARMEREDLGLDPMADAEAHTRNVQQRLIDGRTWVIERDGRVVFQINVGVRTAHGSQIGGTWVPEDLRGRGLGSLGMRATVHTLLKHTPAVTLHVRERNTPAVRSYLSAGFRPLAPFRLLTTR